MYVVDIKHVNQIFDFRVSVFKAIKADEAVAWLEADRANILQHVQVVSEDTKKAQASDNCQRIKSFQGREF